MTVAGITIEERLEIERLVVEYAWLLDHRRFEELPRLFAEDCLLNIRRREIKGHEGLAEWARYRAQKGSRRTQHQMSLLRLTRLSETEIEGTAALVLHVAKSGGHDTYVDLVGEYQDLYVHSDDGWKFSRRHLVKIDEG